MIVSTLIYNLVDILATSSDKEVKILAGTEEDPVEIEINNVVDCDEYLLLT